jgi:hypothetical protein
LDHEPDQSGTSRVRLEELSHRSPLRSQHQEEAEAVPIPLDQQPQENVVDEVRELEGSSNKSEQA